MKGRTIIYSAEELDWIERNCTRPRKASHAEFCTTFARTDVSLTNYNALCKRNGWMTGRTGRIEKGAKAHNKGKPMPYHPNSAATRFKPGGLPHNHRGAGHERICKKDGYVILIIDEVNPWSGAATRPIHKHRHLWEKENGPLPKGMVLKCLDGDKTNCAPSNWRAVSRGALTRLNSRWTPPLEAYEPEVQSTVITIAELQQAAKEAKK
jgi:hypothetical protein